MYLWHILHRDESELIVKMYQAQGCDINRGDWEQIIQEERINLEFLKLMRKSQRCQKIHSKEQFKKKLTNLLLTISIIWRKIILSQHKLLK